MKNDKVIHCSLPADPFLDNDMAEAEEDEEMEDEEAKETINK